MNKILDKQLAKWSKRLSEANQKALIFRLAGLKSVYPFNEYEYRLMYLLGKNVITFKEYENLRNSYVQGNHFLPLYSIAPRVFGEIWAHQHLMDVDLRFKKPSSQIDSRYSGEYDLSGWKENYKNRS